MTRRYASRIAFSAATLPVSAPLAPARGGAVQTRFEPTAEGVCVHLGETGRTRTATRG